MDVVVPVHNEARVLAASIRRLLDHLAGAFPLTWRVTIVDNASTDDTWAEAATLAALHDGVVALHLGEKGRGRALRAAWSASDAAVVAYMDVDLSTDLRALLPQVADQEWFFDTELLLVAERHGLRITEIPVDWTDDPDSRVDVVRTALADLGGMVRVAWRFWAGEPPDPGLGRRRSRPVGSGGELVSFASVGVLSTAAYVVLFVLLRQALGPLAANAVALSATT